MPVTLEATRSPATLSPVAAAHGLPRPVALDQGGAASWTASALNEIGFGILIVSPTGEVAHANRAALAEIAGGHSLKIAERRVCACDVRDAVRLDSAIREAGSRGFRKLLLLGGRGKSTTVAVVPLPGGHRDVQIMLMLGRRDFASPLAVEAFARSQGLTPAETRILLALCEGKAPQEIACEAHVGISTVRSQMISIRQKTGASNLRVLLTQVAGLPPFAGILDQTFGISRLDIFGTTATRPGAAAA